MKLKSAAAGLVIAASLGFASTANATITLTFVGLQNRGADPQLLRWRLWRFWQRARSKRWDHVRGPTRVRSFR